MNPEKSADEGVQTWFIDLPPDECADLLRSADLGRLAVVVNGRPEIFPVSHVYDDESGCVIFPTRPGTKLFAALDWPSVAFEVDGLDPEGLGGWSVLVVGRAEEVTSPAEVARIAPTRRVLWAAGSGALWVRIVPSKVTGRRLSAVVR